MAKTSGLWAPIIKTSRNEWIMWTSVRNTRREAKRSYLEGFDPLKTKKILKNVRFAKVFVEEQPKSIILRQPK